MDPVAFEIGPLTVYWYGIIIASAVIIGLFLVFKENSDFSSNLWKSIPIIFSAGMFLFMVGSIKFASAMNSLKS